MINDPRNVALLNGLELRARARLQEEAEAEDRARALLAQQEADRDKVVTEHTAFITNVLAPKPLPFGGSDAE